MMRTARIALLMLLLISFLVNPASAQHKGDAQPKDTEQRLLSAVVFFHGHVVGRGGYTNGPKMSSDKGKTWTNIAWPEGKSFSVDVSPDGRWVYVAHEIGMKVSCDGGRNWFIGGGWQVTEVQDVRMNRHNPMNAWAATAYGFLRTYDGGRTWEYPGEPQPFGFLSCVCPDRTDTGRVFIGSEVGMFVTPDGGETYRKIGPDAIIRSLYQDLRDPDILWAGTDGDGLWRSDDGGETWRRIEGAGDVINRIAQHPVYRERIYVGNKYAMHFSWDSGKTWTRGGGDFKPNTSVYALAFDPDDDMHIFAGCRTGFYDSHDGGYTWDFISEQNGIINDLYYGPVYIGPAEPVSNEPGNVMKRKSPPPGDELRDKYEPGFEQRADAAKITLAEMPVGDTVGLLHSIAYIKEGKADDEFYEKLRNTLANPGHSMFWFIESIGLYLYCEDELPADIREQLREIVVSTPIIRGDTENHWVMFYSALLLAAQTFPETSPAEWFNWNTSQQNYDNAVEWLGDWSMLTATRGQGEFDSPVYYATFIIPMQILYEFADDPVIKRRAGMILDLLLADFAADALEGRYCGGHSRIYDTQLRWGDGTRDNHFFYFYFGGIDPPEEIIPWDVATIYGSYRCPQSIVDIAHRRDKPFVHTEVKRVRYLMRYADSPESPAYEYGGMMSPPVFRYNYKTPDYCMGSLQGGILQPIQQHTWDVTWIGSAYNTLCFTIHPYWSGYELALFFPEDPHMLTDVVNATKGDYTDPDKWTSSSPYERIFQFEDTLIAVYNVPDGINTDHADLFLPKCLNHEIRQGWIIGRDGDFYIAVRTLVQGEWREHEDNWRYRVHAGQAAFIVETGRAADDGDFANFVDAVLDGPLPEFETTDSGPVVKYVNRHGRKLAYMWDGDMRLMDEPVVPFPDDKFFAGPLMESDIGSGIIKIKGNDSTRILDFNTLSIEEIAG
jgi:photosystem II stability/assembly factor-like uncharacterized protein